MDFERLKKLKLNCEASEIKILRFSSHTETEGVSGLYSSSITALLWIILKRFQFQPLNVRRLIKKDIPIVLNARFTISASQQQAPADLRPGILRNNKP